MVPAVGSPKWELDGDTIKRCNFEIIDQFGNPLTRLSFFFPPLDRNKRERLKGVNWVKWIELIQFRNFGSEGTLRTVRLDSLSLTWLFEGFFFNFYFFEAKNVIKRYKCKCKWQRVGIQWKPSSPSLLMRGHPKRTKFKSDVCSILIYQLT